MASHYGRDRIGGRDVVIRGRSGTGRFIDGFDFLGQPGRIRRDRETPTHDSMVAEPHDKQ
jgi:hypothetical protein